MLTEQPNKSHTDTADLFRVVDLPPISNEAKAAIANITAPSSKSALMQFVNPELSADDMRSIAHHVLRTASEDEPDAHYRSALSYIANISQTADDMRAIARSALNSVSEPNIKDYKHQSESE